MSQRVRQLLVAGVIGVLVGYGYGLLSYKFDLFPVSLIRFVKEYAVGDDTNRVGFRDTTNRQPRDCPQPGTRLAVLLIAGQSNSANHGETRYQARQDVINFNWFDGKCYQARDPLLGATGYGGSIFGRLADRLVESAHYEAVVVAPIGVNASLVERWAPGGDLNPRWHAALDGLRAKGLEPTHVLWQQGEADAMQGASYQDYLAALDAMIADLRDAQVEAPVYVAVATMCHNPGSDAVRAAQRDAVARIDRVLPGPNTDRFDSLAQRHDGCHFTAAALDRIADAWLDAMLVGEGGRGGRPARSP